MLLIPQAVLVAMTRLLEHVYSESHHDLQIEGNGIWCRTCGIAVVLTVTSPLQPMFVPHTCRPPLGSPTREEAIQSLKTIRDLAADVLEHWDQSSRPIVETYAMILTEAARHLPRQAG